jgi:hypothetical protein
MNRAGISRRRRALIAAAFTSLALPLRSLRAQTRAIRVESGTPHRLPRAALDDLEIELDASDGDGPVDIAALVLGTIEIPSGQLAAGDGMRLDGASFARTVSPGRYPVQVVVARYTDETERVAFAQVKFADQAAVRWSNAAFEGDDAEPLAEDELSGYEVESGLGSLFDAQALRSYSQEFVQSPRLRQELEQVLLRNRRPSWSWAWVRTPVGSGILLSSGEGAGFYGSYWGQDASGAIVTLVTDFDLLDWAGLPEAEPVRA